MKRFASPDPFSLVRHCAALLPAFSCWAFVLGAGVQAATCCQQAGAQPGRGNGQQPTAWLGDEARIAWVGDSITHVCRWTRMVESFLLTRYPEKKLYFWNAGVSGDRAGHALARFDEDIASFAPTHALVLLGMNDGEVQDWNERHFAVYERDMTDLVFRLQKIDAKVALLAPTPFDPVARAQKRPGRAVPHYDHVLVRYGEWLRTLADARGAHFVDTHAGLFHANLAIRHVHSKASLIPDGVHPGELGSSFVALDVVLGLFVERESTRPSRRGLLRLAVNKEGAAESEAAVQQILVRGHAIEQLRARGDAIEFDLRASSLPWVLGLGSAELMRLSAKYRHINSVLLEVTGLAPGSHWLNMNGSRTLLRTAAQWARGVEIGHLRSHPDYVAAAQITALNAERNRLVEEGIRDLLYAKKVVPHYQRQGSDQAARYEQQRKELEAKLDATLAEIANLRGRIEALRKPSTVTYALERHN